MKIVRLFLMVIILAVSAIFCNHEHSTAPIEKRNQLQPPTSQSFVPYLWINKADLPPGTKVYYFAGPSIIDGECGDFQYIVNITLNGKTDTYYALIDLPIVNFSYVVIKEERRLCISASNKQYTGYSLQ